MGLSGYALPSECVNQILKLCSSDKEKIISSVDAFKDFLSQLQNLLNTLEIGRLRLHNFRDFPVTDLNAVKIAANIQHVVETIWSNLIATTSVELFGIENLSSEILIAGGFSLNCPLIH